AESNNDYSDTPNDTPFSTQISKGIASDSQTDNNHLATTNTNNNIIINTKKIFRETVFAHTNFNNKILESFFNYWSELNLEKTKMRFETEQFFEVEKRLEKWQKNERNFTIKSKEKPQLNTNR